MENKRKLFNVNFFGNTELLTICQYKILFIDDGYGPSVLLLSHFLIFNL